MPTCSWLFTGRPTMADNVSIGARISIQTKLLVAGIYLLSMAGIVMANEPLYGFAMLLIGMAPAVLLTVRIKLLAKSEKNNEIWFFLSIAIMLVGALLSPGITLSFFMASTSNLMLWAIVFVQSPKDAPKYLSPLIIAILASLVSTEEIGYTLIQLFCISIVIFICAVQFEKHTNKSARPNRSAFLVFGKIGAVSLISGVVIFFAFPRLPLGFNDRPGGSGNTGLSWDMEPGNVSELVRTNKLAFTATFDGPTPLNQDLYWRAIVFTSFNGKKWLAAENPGSEANLATIPKNGSWLKYQLLLPSSMAPFVPLLDKTILNRVSIASPDGVEMNSKPDSRGTIYSSKDVKVTTRVHAQAIFSPQIMVDSGYTNQDLQLPKNINPQTRALAQQWMLESRQDPEQFVSKLQTHIRNEGYRYTLKPTLWKDENGIDDFWTKYKAGFCEHYAGASVFILRSAGIPARVVTGFQGGNVNLKDNSVTVYSRDAHAWTEVWLSGRWQRFDPTGFIDPSRVEVETQEVISRSPGWLLKLETIGHKLASAWNEHIVTYDINKQIDFLYAIVKNFRPIAMMLCFISIISIAAWRTRSFLIHRRFWLAMSPDEKLAYLYKSFQRQISQSIQLNTSNTRTAQEVLESLRNLPSDPKTLKATAWLMQYIEARYTQLKDQDSMIEQLRIQLPKIKA